MTTLSQLLDRLYYEMTRSPLVVPLVITDENMRMYFGTSHDEHIRQLIIKQPYVKRWAVYNDESAIMIELEGGRK